MASKGAQRRRNAERRSLGANNVVNQRIPDHVLQERDVRMKARRSPIAELLGDPPPGRSALDAITRHKAGVF